MLFRKILGWILVAIGVLFFMDAFGEILLWRGRTRLGEEPGSWVAGALVSAIVAITLIWLGISQLRIAGGRGRRISLAILGWGAIALGLLIVVAGIIDRDPAAVAVATFAFGAVGYVLLHQVAKLKPQAHPPDVPPPPTSTETTSPTVTPPW